MTSKVALVILDGWGIGRKDSSNAIFQAYTPFTDFLNQNYSHTTLRTDGENVGLPIGQMGNSEVGHMNIGAGRIVWQMLAKIEQQLHHPQFKLSDSWNHFIGSAKKSGRLHLIGLVSDGGVHSHINHLEQLLKLISEYQIPEVYIHAFTDGRDTDPKSGLVYLQSLQQTCSQYGATISTVVGRYYAMDRDKRWERIKVAYDLMVHGTGEHSHDLISTLKNKYQDGITDEFMTPINCLNGNKGFIKDGDTILSFNFRTDRGREITEALSQKAFDTYQMHPLDVHYYTMTTYDETFKISGVLFEQENLNLTLGEVLEINGKTQLRAAETEKYPHVTFFFSGGRETPFQGEKRILVNSPKVPTYDLQPEMSAVELTEKVITHIQEQSPDFICVNYANPDMVGHTGVFPAIVQAVETVDACLKKLIDVLLKLDYQSIVIADHGNAEFAVNDDGTPNTAHTTNPVPIWYIAKNQSINLQPGKLADIAPTILSLMQIVQPKEMTGQSLIS